MALLSEPSPDAHLDALDRAVVEAVRARAAAGARDRADASVLVLREVLNGAGPLETAAIRAVWGRIEAATGPAMALSGGRAQLLAADRYGPGVRPVTADAAFQAAQQGARALMDLSGDRPWWGRLLARPDIRVIAALPDDRRARPQALLIARQASGPTGDDRSFWVTDSTQPDDRIVAALGRAGLIADPLAAAGGLKLFMLTGYVQAEDGRLIDAPGRLCGVIGAAPVF